MQLTGSSSNHWALQTLWKTDYVSFWQNQLIPRFPIAAQTAWLKCLKDPSSVFKDAVDRQFQWSLSAPNPLNDLSCVLVTKSTHLKILNCHTNCRAEIFEGSFKYLQGCSWRAVPVSPDSSKSSIMIVVTLHVIINSIHNCSLTHQNHE